MADNFALEGAAVDAREMLDLGWVQEGFVRNVAKMIWHHPDVPFRGHPFVAVEAREIHRARIATQGAFAAQVEVDVEIT